MCGVRCTIIILLRFFCEFKEREKNSFADPKHDELILHAGGAYILYKKQNESI